jgi:hypothetical protein
MGQLSRQYYVLIVRTESRNFELVGFFCEPAKGRASAGPLMVVRAVRSGLRGAGSNFAAVAALLLAYLIWANPDEVLNGSLRPGPTQSWLHS